MKVVMVEIETTKTPPSFALVGAVLAKSIWDLRTFTSSSATCLFIALAQFYI